MGRTLTNRHYVVLLLGLAFASLAMQRVTRATHDGTRAALDARAKT